MLDKNSPILYHILQNVALIFLSIFMLVPDAYVLLVCYSLNFIRRVVHGSGQKSASSKSRTILVTGVGMTKGLCLARLFHQEGHRVIGADFVGACGQMSRAIEKFYTLPVPDDCNPGYSYDKYVSSLVDIVEAEEVDLWVSCSGVAHALLDGQAKEAIESETPCKAVQFDAKTTEMLHEKHTFIARAREIGLNVPETHVVSSVEDASRILARQGMEKARFILKPMAVNDAARGDMTLLPLQTTKSTEEHLRRLEIDSSHPWIMQQFIRGREYCTHSLVIRGQVRAFVACPSSELLMHYEALAPASALSRAMLEFTEKFALAEGSQFTGHLSFDFLVEENEQGTKQVAPKKVMLWPIECNPRAHTADVLFADTPEIVDQYLSSLEQQKHGDCESYTQNITSPRGAKKYYWTGQDFVAEFVIPIASFLSGQQGFSTTLSALGGFINRLFFWKDGTLETWDPLPWFFLYHVFWPMKFLLSILKNQRWSRVNVSTTKIWAC